MSLSDKVLKAKIIGGGVLGAIALGVVIFILVKLSSFIKDAGKEVEETIKDVQDIAQDTVTETIEDVQTLEETIGYDLPPAQEAVITYSYGIDEIIEGCNEKINDPNESTLTKVVARGIKWYIAYLAILNPLLLFMYLIGKLKIADLLAKVPEPPLPPTITVSAIEIQHQLTFAVRLAELYYSVDNATARLKLNEYYAASNEFMPPQLMGFADRVKRHPLYFSNVGTAMKEVYAQIEKERIYGIDTQEVYSLTSSTTSLTYYQLKLQQYEDMM